MREQTRILPPGTSGIEPSQCAELKMSNMKKAYGRSDTLVFYSYIDKWQQLPIF
jgi:hypothetical protein